MPKQYPCDMECGMPADFMLTAITTGEALTVCVRCLPAWTEAIVRALDQLDNVDPEPSAPIPVTVKDPDPSWEYLQPEPTPRHKVASKRGNGQTPAATETAPAAVDHE